MARELLRSPRPGGVADGWEALSYGLAVQRVHLHRALLDAFAHSRDILVDRW
ncbi:hypothetical protein [Kitasatospora sp. NPDC088346]|uniref:hypothetical protein n=1 Tax=Kitasatospora sp. NPDC088346 TaxID=3364073 RepID=UPI0038238EA8